ncbi:MAG: hypothetical protein GXP32_04285 [Kiritimatiellaeota bacterium]|nr:hypothetical protein [Kiritimatiellota bacterium]
MNARKNGIAVKTLLLAVLAIAAAALTSSCSSPQERRGVSYIPINAPGPQDTRGIDGNL